MKMKNLVAYAMLALGAFAAVPTACAADDKGDIRSIYAVNAPTVIYPNGTSPLRAGDELYILVRLANQDYGEVGGGHPWMFLPTSSSLSSEYLTSYMYVPKLGLSVGGKHQYAEYSDYGPNGEKSGQNMAYPAFTELYFRYTVQPGDLGLPVKLICSDNHVPGESSNTDLELVNVNTAVLSLPTNPWKLGNLIDTEDGGRLVNFHLGPDDLLGDPSEPDPIMRPDGKDYGRDYTFVREGAHVQTIDFEPTYVDPEASPKPVWREVYPNSADYVVIPPQLKGAGPATVWVWSSDAAVFDVTGEPSDIKTVDGTNYLKIAIGTGDSELLTPFRLKGSTAEVGATATIYMGPLPAPESSAVGDVLAHSTVTRTVRMANPPPPNVKVTFDPEGLVTTKKVDPVPDCPAEEMAEKNLTVPIYVTLSETFASDFHVRMKVTLTDDAACDVFTNKFIGMSASNSSTGYLEAYTNVEVKAGTKQLPVYLYPLGADGRTLNGIKIESVIVEEAAKEKFAGDILPLVITLRDVKPTVVSPTASDSLSADKKTGCPIPIEVKDCYRDLNTPQTYTVEYSWDAGTGGTISGVKFRAGQTTVTNATGFSSKATKVRLRVQDAQGNWSSWSDYISVLVEATKTVKPELVREQSETEPAIEVLKFAEGESVNLRFRIEPETASSMSDMFAFLLPLNEASSNLVKSAAFTEGVPFPAEHDVSKVVSTAALTFLDGCAKAEDLRFGVMLRTESSLTNGTEITDYTAQTMYVSVTNRLPRILTVEKNNEVIPNGGEGKTVAAGVPATFKATLDDFSVIDITNEQKLVTYWYVTDGAGATEVFTVTSTVSSVSAYAMFEHTFQAEGENGTVQVVVRDKDMSDKDFTLAPRYSFSFPIKESPYIYFTDPSGNGKEEGDLLTYSENVTKSKGYINVNLSEAPGSEMTKNKPLVIRVKWDSWGADGVVTSETETVSIYGSGTTAKLYLDLKTLDGGQDTMYNISAEVVNTTSNKYGVAWKDYYVGRDAQIVVYNVDPRIVSVSSETLSLSETTTNTATLNVGHAIKWSAGDIAPDTTNDFKVTWIGSWGLYKQQTTSGMSWSADWKTVSGVISNVAITAEGYQSLTMKVEDKDGGVDERIWWFYISPTKKIIVSPYGPAGSTQSTKYDIAPGIGKGRVYTAAARSTQQGFRHTFYFDVTEDQTELYAFGYPAGENVEDNGELAPAGYDIKLNSNGGTWTSGAYYKPRMVYDSFFYCWLDFSETPALKENLIGVPKPAASPTNETYATLKHEKFEGKSDKTYETKNIEAIFSREMLASDNMGDINLDYVPDLYVKFYKLDGDPAAVPKDDLEDKWGLNEDEDYLPFGLSVTYSQLIPGLPESWASLGVAFDARREVRGFHDGLNDAPEQIGLRDAKPDRIYEVDGAYDPEKCTISALEYQAWKESGLAANKWSPERPTDPTKADTDKDGYPDGYEYYFWYKAHVGYMVGTNHVYLTGEKFDPTNPHKGLLITSEAIERAFDPRDPADRETSDLRDTDNDGLPDLMEFELGTNPVHWDSDGDGLPDGYEVMHAEDLGLDPLVASSDKATLDGNRNDDGDWMAIASYPEKRTVIGTLRGDGRVDYYHFDAGLIAGVAPTEGDQRTVKVADAETVDGWLIATADGATNVTTRAEAPATVEVNGALYLATDLLPTECWEQRKSAEEDKKEAIYKGLPVFVGRGTALIEPPSAITVTPQTLAFTGTDGAPVDVLAITNPLPYRAISAWIYGRDWKEAASIDPSLYGVAYYNERGQLDREHGKRSPHYVCGLDVDVKAGLEVCVAPADLTKPAPSSISVIHHHVYQHYEFDPRTAWGRTSKNSNPPNSRKYNVYDEFLMSGFFYNSGDATAAELTPTRLTPLTDIWAKYSTNPAKADTDDDGMPDGWEAYLMSGPKLDRKRSLIMIAGEMVPGVVTIGALSPFSPLVSFDEISDARLRDEDVQSIFGDGMGGYTITYVNDFLEWPQEFAGSDSSAYYEGLGCETITVDEEIQKWRNKQWPTDPWAWDTDGDGICDGREKAEVFIYGDPNATGTAGGGLNPLSWDTDGDGLPDPWELEFAGHYVAGSATDTAGGGDTNSFTVVTAPDGTVTTNRPDSVAREGGHWEGGMDGTSSDAGLDYDKDGLLNWQEYMTGTVRAWRYDDPCSRWDFSQYGTGMMGLNVFPGELQELKLPVSPEERDFDDPYDWDNFWSNLLIDGRKTEFNPSLGGTHFDPAGAYFSCCRHPWDGNAFKKWYYFSDGIDHDLRYPGEGWVRDLSQYTGEIPSPVQFNRYTIMYYDTKNAAFIINPVQLQGTAFIGSLDKLKLFVFPTKYISCDPRKHDSDHDGMDDFYEVYHGLNPLLGASAAPDVGDQPCDLVFEAYNPGGTYEWYGERPGTAIFQAENNFWLNSENPQMPATRQKSQEFTYDFTAYPWLAGLATADPDGDNIRNREEAIMPDLQAQSTWHHTDPSALWMTDSSYTNSLTRRYYKLTTVNESPEMPIECIEDPNFVPTFWADLNDDGVKQDYEIFDIRDFPYFHFIAKTETKPAMLTFDGVDLNRWGLASEGRWGGYIGEFWQWMFSFEEDEGYDSDHDYLSDYTEAQGKTRAASDPQDADDPRRRQAMYFDGVNAFLETPLLTAEPPPDGMGSMPDMPFLYYTVECWAKAEDPTKGGLQTLVERAIYVGQSNPGDMQLVRKNFLIGIKDGKWYTRFDSTGTDIGQFEEIADGPDATTDWTHVAATFDGANLTLFVNGAPKVVKPVKIQPEHGTDVLRITPYGSLESAKDQDYIAVLVGADALTLSGIVFDGPSRYPMDSNFHSPMVGNDYGALFKGYVDEVRIWDGARTVDEIKTDFRRRYTRDDALANRDKVFAGLMSGQDRSPSTLTMLPAELKYHFTFDHVPGATQVKWVEKVPSGFSTAAKYDDAKAILTRPTKWTSPWWGTMSQSTHSSIYSDYAWTPWIVNTVYHLPYYDGSTGDSMYWSKYLAGGELATAVGLTSFNFPLTCETSSRRVNLMFKTPAGRGLPTYFNAVRESGAEGILDRQVFTWRHRYAQGMDLLPMGGAYPKRISADEGGMWDEQGPADAWGETGADVNGDGLPEWWVTYARLHYSANLTPRDLITWNTIVTYGDVLMPAWQAYLRDLAKGMLPDTKEHPEYVNVADADSDGLPDWWEEFWSLGRYTGMDDPDHDGLSNFQEWKIAEDEKSGFGAKNGFPLLNPNLARSSSAQDEVDYFLRTFNAPWAGWYYGEIVADHDFMEDDNEDMMGTDRTKYDAWSDNDEDGWTAFSEMRYSTFKMTRAAKFLSHMNATEEVKDFPIPVIHTTLRYNGEKTLSGSNAMIVVEAYSGNNLQKPANARYAVVPGTTLARTLYLGGFEERVIHGTMTPGYVRGDRDQVWLETAFIQSNENWAWEVDGRAYSGTYAEMYAAYLANPATFHVASEDFEWIRVSDGDSTPIDGKSVSALQISVDEQTQQGYMMIFRERVGTVNLKTGDFTLDVTKLKGIYSMATGVRVDQSFMRLLYTSQIPTLQTKALAVSLADPDEGHLTEGKTAFVAYMDLDGDGYTPDRDPIGFVKDVDVSWDNVPEITIEMTDSTESSPARFAYGADVGTLRIVRTQFNGSSFLDEEGKEPVKRRIVFSREAKDVERRTVFEGDLVTSTRFGLDWTGLRRDILDSGLALKDVTEVTYVIAKDLDSVDHIDASKVLGSFTVAFAAQQTKPTAVSPSAKSYPFVESVRPVFRWTGTADNTAFMFKVLDTAGRTVCSTGMQVLPARDGSGQYVWTAPFFVCTNNVCKDAWALENNKTYRWQVAMFNPKYSKEEDALWSDPAEFTTAVAPRNDFTTPKGTANVTVRYFGPATNALDTVLVQLYRTADFTGVAAAQTRLVDLAGDVQALTDTVHTVTFTGLDAGDYYAVAFIDRNGNVRRDRWETWGYANQVGLGVQAIYTPVALSVDPASSLKPSVEILMEDTDVNQDKIPDCLTADESLLSAASAGSSAGTDTSDVDGDGLTGEDEEGDTYTDKTKWDTDGDDMPDGWEARFADLDPLFPDAEACAAGDVMAYAEVKRTLVTVKSTETGAKATYALTADDREPPRVGDNVNGRVFLTTYDYVGDVKGVGLTNAVPSWTEYWLAAVSNTATHAAGDLLFAPEDDLVLDAGTNVNGRTAFTWTKDADGIYHLDAETNLFVSVADEAAGMTNLVTATPALVKVSLGENRVIEVKENAKIALVHAQVYDAYGFDQKTAVAAPDAVRTKPFTAIDKYLLVRYFQAIGIREADEDLMNRSGRWEEFTLRPNDTDNDLDGIADGWELYVMFGTNTVAAAPAYAKPADTPINPWTYADRASDQDGEGLELIDEYARGLAPMNPWNAHTFIPDISDKKVSEYNLFTADTQLDDDDQDGLSNWAEYLAAEVYGFGFFDVQDPYSCRTNVLDYFVTVTNGPYAGWYVGEVVADHDFIDDWWEDQYDAEVANRYVYDPAKDADGDGWSNWSEARAATDPSSFGRLSLVRSDGSENNVVDEYPIPRIHMQLSYDSAQPFVSPVVVKAWKGGSLAGAPDAVWHVAGAVDVEPEEGAEAGETEAKSTATKGVSGVEQSRFIGLNPGKKIRLNIGPGAIAEGHVKLTFYDPRYHVEHLTISTNESDNVIRWDGKNWTRMYTWHSIDSSNWAGGNWWPDFPQDKRYGTTTGVIKHGSENAAEAADDAAYEVVGWVDYKTGDVELDFTAPSLSNTDFTSGEPTSENTYDRYHYNLVRSYWRISWVSRLISGGKVKSFTLDKPDVLSDKTFGHLREGVNTFIAFADDNGNGEWDEGEPFGIARDVEIGWDQANVAIELTDESAAFKRLAVASYAAAGGDTNAVADAGAAETPATAETVRRVRVVRKSVNGVTLPKQRMVFAKNVDLEARDWLAENDYVKSGHWDFDDTYLVADAQAANIDFADIRTAEYEVYFGDGTLEGRAPDATWTKEFTVSRVAPAVAGPCTNANYLVRSAQPTLCWKGPKGYTAFALQIAKDATFSAGSLVYSTTNFLPAATTEGYSFKAPVYVGKELADQTAYYWRVCELNAKFTTPGDWSDTACFRTAIDSKNADTGYGPIAAEVRYYGPATNTLAQVVVGVYESADFTGLPVARKILGSAELGVTSLAYRAAEGVDWIEVSTNVTFDGIAPGLYYVMAFVDANGNGKRDRFETWGYANHVGLEEFESLYDPIETAVVSTKGTPATALVVMEDTDCNQNRQPDCLEDPSIFAAGGGDSGDGSLDSDKDGLSDFDEENDTGTEVYVWDTDGDGMPDGWEARFAGTDPLNADGDEVVDGDVMAYAVTNMTVVTLWDGANVESATNKFAIADRNATLTVGDTVTGLRLYRTYAYGSQTGLGPINAADVSGLKVYGVKEDAAVVLVHAQVYDAFGFDPLTASPALPPAEWTNHNTKAFTALDKYMLVRYLQNFGIADEVTMNTNRTWSASTLKPGEVDNDRDGVADGWELYVMFGPNATKSAATMKFSPWNYDDARDMALDFDGDGLNARDEYNKGDVRTDPWDAYSMYKYLRAKGLLLPGTSQFSDTVARRFPFSAATKDDDLDLDLITNLEEMQGYYRDPTALADLSITNAWSDGETPDYFRACGSKYLGEIFNGAEFIEGDWRDLLGLGDKSRWGTRTFRVSGWDYWSIVRNSDGGAASAKDDGDLAFVLNYLDAVVPGECTAKTLTELREFVHQKWNGVERDVRQGDYWNEDYSYSYVYDEATGTYHYQTDRGEDDSVTWMTLSGDKLVTLEEMIQFFGGRKMMNQTIAKNLKADSEDDIVIPTPVMNLTLKYAGDSKCVVLVEAYQVNPAYPEYGEQRTAFWNVSAEFSAGVASPTLESPNAGSLKQGPARFVAYVDVDGDGKLSPADTWGETSVNVGYLGADVTIRLGDANPALPVLRTGDGSNTTWSTIAIVRSAINGKPLYNRSQGVNFCTFENNVSRRAIFPSEYISDSFVGIDTTLAVHYSGEELENIESVTYEVLRIPRGDLETISVTNLNHYIIVTNGVDEALVTNVFDSAVNEEFTVRYSNKRDKADKFTWAGSTEEDCSFSFSVPDDGFANTRFWLKVNGTEFGGTVGFPLTGLAGGRMVLDSKWLAKNGVAAELKAGEENSFTVMLGNDKFGYDKAGWPDPVKFFVGVKPVFDGKLLVEVRHPANAALGATLTVAAYEKPDLAEPVVTVTGQSLGNVVTLSGLRVGQAYYIAAWYVKDADDGRGSATRRMPYDTWGYLTSLGEAANGFDAKAVAAVDPANRMIEVPMVTNLVFLQDTDWNDNNVIDREEAIVSENSVITGSVSAGGEFKIVDAENPDPQGGSLIDNDVMAYAVVTYPCVSVTVGADEYLFAITDLANELTTNRLTRGIPVGTPVRELRSLKATYKYDFGKSDPEVIGLGTNVQFAADCDWTVSEFMECGLVLVHAQVYDAFGFCPNTANGSIPSSSWVNTKSFTREDRAFVTNYYANVCGVAEAWKYAIPSGSNDSDADGIINGWELYVMYGPKGAGKNAMAHNPLKPEDRHFDADGDGLDQLHEYDGGYLPTDPWNADTDRDNVTDYYAWLYHLKSPADAAADWDGDGLSNYAEYLIAEVFKLASSVRPDATHSSDGVLDYFRKQGELYLGEIFTDHDHMTDAVEDLFPEMNRYLYDAHEDGDGDGWSNWAELCASVAAGFESVTVAVTNGDRVVTTTSRRPLYTGHPRPELRLKLRYGGVQDIVGASVVIKAFTQAEAFLPDAVFVVSNAIVNAGSNELRVRVPDSGYLREGANTFFVYLSAAREDGGESGKGSDDTSSASAASNDYVAGAPFAVMRDVDVGWSAVNLDVQLTDTDPSFARLPFAYAAGNSDREAIWGGSTTTAGTNKQGQAIMHYGSSDVEINPYYTGDLSALLNTKLTRIRVKRARVDGQQATQGSLDHRVIYDKYVPTASRSFICEYDVIGAGEFDIDWAHFDEIRNDELVDSYGFPITQVVYRVCIGEGAFNINTKTNDEPWIEVSRRFEATRTVPVATADSGVFYSARPTLTWTMGDGGNPRAGDTYSAFRVVITPAKGSAINSGLMLRPVRDAKGRYSWTGPALPPGDYTWKVSMYNAKFQTDAFSNAGKFSMATDLQQEMNDHGYGMFGVAVKYAGPANVLASGKVHVEAYDTPDFSGEPLSETILPANTASLAALASPTANCTVAGLRMGGTYYFRAYIDTNGNGRRDIWESWGYAKASNSDSVARPFTLAGVASPVVGIFIEDCDTDQDWLPDAWEMAKNGSLEKQGASVDLEGKIVFRGSTYEGLAGISTGLPGASLTVFNNLAVAKEMLGLSGEITIDAIREAVEKKIVKDSVKITALTFDQTNGKVILNVDAEVALSVAGAILSRFYTVSSPDTVTVKVKVYKVESLAEAWPSDPVVTKEVSFGAGEQEVTVLLGEGDFTSGFFKIEVEQ